MLNKYLQLLRWQQKNNIKVSSSSFVKQGLTRNQKASILLKSCKKLNVNGLSSRDDKGIQNIDDYLKIKFQKSFLGDANNRFTIKSIKVYVKE